MAGFMMAVPVGVMLSSAATGPAAQAWGWRVALALAAAPAALLVPALLWLREPERAVAPGAASGPAPLGLLRIPALWWIAASGAIANFALYSFSAFLPAFLKRYHGLSVGQAGLATGIGSARRAFWEPWRRASGATALLPAGATDACCWRRGPR